MENHYAVVEGVEFGFFPLASGCSILWVFADRQAYPPVILAPFEVIGAFWMPFLLAVDENQIVLDATVWRQDDRAVPHAF